MTNQPPDSQEAGVAGRGCACLLTGDGCEVITADVSKELEAVEALMAEQGVLDWMDGR